MNACGIVVLDAPGATEKTFIINLLLTRFALAAVSSQVSTLLNIGRPGHSAFKLPLKHGSFSASTMQHLQRDLASQDAVVGVANFQKKMGDPLLCNKKTCNKCWQASIGGEPLFFLIENPTYLLYMHFKIKVVVVKTVSRGLLQMSSMQV